MKQYIEPSIMVVAIGTVQMIAASGDSKSDVAIMETEYTGTFSSREFDYEDEEN